MKLRTGQQIAFAAEMAAAGRAQSQSRLDAAFRHLERAHVIGQRNVAAHTRAHLGMLRIGWLRNDRREVIGQLLRIAAALTKTLIWVPRGNTGGTDIGALQSMPIPADLRHLVD